MTHISYKSLLVQLVIRLLVPFLLIAASKYVVTADASQMMSPQEYGVDVSYPIHYNLDPDSFQAIRFKKMIAGCYTKYGRGACDSTDRARMAMNLEQPPLQHNYTELGFKKLKVPKAAWEPLRAFWDANKHTQFLEEWPEGNIYTNHWESPTYMVSLEDGRLRGFGAALKQKVWDGVKPVLEEWVGHKLTPTSMYGIRVYKTNAMLATHVDRMPLVTSCIINVDQDVDEPWPVEVYSHDGKAYNVSMEPGDMVLYESSTVLHGRPAPLKGKYFANIFVHFEPIDHEEMNAKDHPMATVDRSFLKRTKRQFGGHEQNNLDEAAIGKHYQDVEEDNGQTDLHSAAAEGDLGQVKRILQKDSKLLHARDRNHWQPLHEAARSGHVEVVKFLVKEGADLSARTSQGGTALWWARRLLESGDEVITFLESIDAPEEGEDL
eukprot:gene3566-7092_t